MRYATSSSQAWHNRMAYKREGVAVHLLFYSILLAPIKAAKGRDYRSRGGGDSALIAAWSTGCKSLLQSWRLKTANG